MDPINDAHGIRTKHKIVFSKGIHLIVPRLSSERVPAFFDDTQRLFYDPDGHPIGDRDN